MLVEKILRIIALPMDVVIVIPNVKENKLIVLKGFLQDDEI